jgi:hypothetical protein
MKRQLAQLGEILHERRFEALQFKKMPANMLAITTTKACLVTPAVLICC